MPNLLNIIAMSSVMMAYLIFLQFWARAFFRSQLGPRPAVLAAAQRGLYQRDQRNNHQ